MSLYDAATAKLVDEAIKKALEDMDGGRFQKIVSTAVYGYLESGEFKDDLTEAVSEHGFAYSVAKKIAAGLEGVKFNVTMEKGE